MTYVADQDRYSRMPYRRCGRSGLKLTAISRAGDGVNIRAASSDADEPWTDTFATIAP